MARKRASPRSGTPLHELNNLFLTPRLGSHTREARLRASWYVAHRIHETLTGAAPNSVRPVAERADGPGAALATSSAGDATPPS